MIGKVSGRVDYVAEDHVLIEANGVGYIVYCAAPTLAALPAPGETAALYTEMVVREDLIQLFGFRSVAERDWHRLLTSVQGVGARVSLAILGALGNAGVGRALAAGDVHAIRATPGVGPKLAARIVSELKGKAPEALMRAGAPGGAATPAPVPGAGAQSASSAPAPQAQMAAAGPAPDAAEQTAMADAVSALINLGYDRSEAARAVAGAEPESSGPEPLIKAALRALAREL